MSRRSLQLAPADEVLGLDAPWRKPVAVMPLGQYIPKLAQVKEFRSKQVLLSHDHTRLFDVVSSKYRVVQHAEAVDTVQSALQRYFGRGADMRASVRTIDGGARIFAEFRLPIDPIKLGSKDVNEITLTVRNSYDRSWTLDAALGAFRLVCSNGARIGESFGSVSLKHVGEQSATLEHLDTVISRAPMLKDVWTEWADTQVEKEEAVALLEGRFPNKYLEPIIGDQAVYPMSKWQLYNHLTRFATHDTKSLRRRVEFDEEISRLFYSDLAVAV